MREHYLFINAFPGFEPAHPGREGGSSFVVVRLISVMLLKLIF